MIKAFINLNYTTLDFIMTHEVEIHKVITSKKQTKQIEDNNLFKNN